MEYSAKSLDLALSVLLPNIVKNETSIASYTRPDLIKMVAWNHFIRSVSEDTAMVRDYDKSMCLYVVQQSAFELHKTGYMTFGIRELSKDLEK